MLSITLQMIALFLAALVLSLGAAALIARVADAQTPPASTPVVSGNNCIDGTTGQPCPPRGDYTLGHGCMMNPGPFLSLHGAGDIMVMLLAAPLAVGVMRRRR